MNASRRFQTFIDSPIGYISYFYTEFLVEGQTGTLNDFTEEIKTGKTPSMKVGKYYEGAEWSWFKPDEIGCDVHLTDSKNRLSKYAISENQATVYKPNTLLITCIGDIGRMGILTKASSSNQQITGLLFNSTVIPDYGYYFLMCRKDILQSKASSTTLPILNQKKLLSIGFKCPSLKQQSEFVRYMDYCWGCLKNNLVPESNDFKLDPRLFQFAIKIFSIWYLRDRLKFANKTNLESIIKLKSIILQEAVQGKLVAQDPNDEPASELLKKIQVEKERLVKEKKIKNEKPLPKITEYEIPWELPEGWEWVRLGQVAEFKNGLSKREGSIGSLITVLRLADVNNFQFTVENARQIFVTDQEIINYGIFSNELVLIRVNGSKNLVGRAVRYKEEQPAAFCDHLMKMSLMGSIFEKYFWYLFNSNVLRNEIESKIITTAGQNTINQKSLSIIMIPLPPVNEQKRIAAKVDQLMQLCDELEDSISKAQADSELLMQAVLQEAYSGIREATMGDKVY